MMRAVSGSAQGRLAITTGGGGIASTILGGLAAVALAIAIAAIAAPTADARDSFAFADTYDFDGNFGATGPGMMTVHGESETLYVVDPPNNRILKFDISDPLNPQPEDFSGLGSNELTQADGANLVLAARSNIVVDNSGGPQDGTLYLATNTAADSRAHAFSSTGEWLYTFAHDADGNFDPNGTPQPGLAIAVANAGPRAGQVTRFGTPVGFTNSNTASYAPAVEPGGIPTVLANGTTGGTLSPTGMFSASYSADGETIRAHKLATFGGTVSRTESVRAAGLAAEGYFSYDTGFDAGFSYDGSSVIVRTASDGGSLFRVRQTGFSSFFPPSTGSELIGRFGFGQQGTGTGIAESAAGYLYVSDASSGELRIFAPATAPDAEMEEPGSVDLNTAELRATVNAQNLNITSCEFEWGTATSYANPAEPCDVTPTGDGDVVVTAEVAVVPRTTYHTRIVVAADNATVTASPDLEWQAPDLPEAVTLAAGPQQRGGTAVLGGTVDPNQTPTGYHIEYSTDPGLAGAERFPADEDVPVEVGDSPVRVSQAVPGLANDTAYYFRVVAETKAGTDVGAIESFRTFTEGSVPQPTDCANVELRTGASAALPDCRAWEQISPQDKNGGQVSQGAIVASTDGLRATFSAGSIFAGARSLGTLTDYMAQRIDGQWITEATAPASTIPVKEVTYNLPVKHQTPDLSRAIGNGPNVDLPGAEPSNTVAYLWDTELGANLPVAISGPPASGREIGSVDIADDGRSGFVWGNRIPVDSGPSVASGKSGAYWWSQVGDGFQVELASLMPNGDPAAEGTNGVVFDPLHLSGDGDRLLWFASDPQGRVGSQEVYLSRRGETTLWASEAQGTTQPATTTAKIQAWTPDLRYVYFTSVQQLTADATAAAGRPDLYRYDTETETLEDLTVGDATGADVEGVSNLSASGSHVYFYATGNLAPGASGSGLKLYGSHDGQIRLITDQPASLSAGYLFTGIIDAAYKRLARVSPDGRYLLFPYQGSTAGTRMDSVYETNGHRLFYRYDWDEDRIDCVSCDPQGRPMTADGYLTMPQDFRSNGAANPYTTGGERRFMTADGDVMFNTRQSLLTDDVNNKVDAYVWDGDLRLLTSGSSDNHQWSEDATAGFEDIYVISSSQLVPADTDGAADVYVAMVDGGLASQQVRPSAGRDGCDGEACQGIRSDSPRLPRLDSTAPTAEPPANRCATRRAAFRRTAKRLRTRRAGFRKARKSASVSVRRHKRLRRLDARGANIGERRQMRVRRGVVRSKRRLRRQRVALKRVAKQHRRSKAALVRCRRGDS